MWLVEHRWPRSTPPYNDDILDLLITFKPGRNFRPGTRFHYDNTGSPVEYVVRGIEKILSRPRRRLPPCTALNPAHRLQERSVREHNSKEQYRPCEVKMEKAVPKR